MLPPPPLQRPRADPCLAAGTPMLQARGVSAVLASARSGLGSRSVGNPARKAPSPRDVRSERRQGHGAGAEGQRPAASVRRRLSSETDTPLHRGFVPQGDLPLLRGLEGP